MKLIGVIAEFNPFHNGHAYLIEEARRKVTEETGEETNDKVTHVTGSKPGLTMTIFVNDEPVVLSGKPDYVFVDVFDFIDFDLSKPQGKAVITLHNGKPAQYVDPLKEGDKLTISWKD